MGKNTTLLYVLGIILIVGVGFWYFNGETTASVVSVADATTQSGTTTEVTKVAVSPEDTSIIYAINDKYVSTKSLTGTNRIIEDNLPAVTTLATIDPYATLTYWLDNSSVFNAPQTVSINGKSTYSVQQYGIQNCTYSTSFMKLFNEENNLASLDATTTNITIGSGESLTLDLMLQSGDNCGLASFGAIIVVEGNSSEYTNLIVDCGSDITSTASVPGFYTVASTANIAKAYLVNADLSDNAKKSCSLILKAKSGTDPSPGTVGSSTILVNMYPRQYYLEQDNVGVDQIQLGVEDNLNTAKHPGLIQNTYGIE